ncbi:MAG: hypothetical protein ACXVCL_15200 [Bdellovibrio sp.]
MINFLIVVFSLVVLPHWVSADSKLQNTVHFLSEKQAQLTQAYAGWKGLNCPDFSDEEKLLVQKKLIENSKCDYKSDKAALLEQLDDLYFHAQTVEYKKSLSCEIQKNDCLSERDNLHRYARLLISVNGKNMVAFGKVLKGVPLNPEESQFFKKIDESIPDNIFNDQKDSRGRKIDYCEMIKKFHQKSTLLNMPESGDCFSNLKVIFKMIIWERETDPLYYENKDVLKSFFLDALENKVKDPCKLKQNLENKVKDFLYDRRIQLEKEQGKINRSCYPQTTASNNKCFYKPPFQMKRYLMEMNFSLFDQWDINSQQENLNLGKYWCHLNQTYNMGDKMLNGDLKDYAIPTLGLVLGGYGFSLIKKPALWALEPIATEVQLSGSIVSAQISKSVAQKKILKSSVSAAKAAGKAAVRTVGLAGLGLTGQNISKACLDSFGEIQENYLRNYKKNRSHYNDCSCRTILHRPTTQHQADCQVELVKYLIGRSFGTFSRTLTAMKVSNAENGISIEQQYSELIDQHFSSIQQDAQNLLESPEKIKRLEEVTEKVLGTKSEECH